MRPTMSANGEFDNLHYLRVTEVCAKHLIHHFPDLGYLSPVTPREERLVLAEVVIQFCAVFGISGDPVGGFPPLHCLPQDQCLAKIPKAGQGFSSPCIGKPGPDPLSVPVDELNIFQSILCGYVRSLLCSEKTGDEGDRNNIGGTFPESARPKRRSDGLPDFARYWIWLSIGHAAIGDSLWADPNTHMSAGCGAASK